MAKYSYGGQTFEVDHTPSVEEFQQMSSMVDAQNASNQSKQDAVAYGGENPGLLTQFLGGAKHAWDSSAYGLQQSVEGLTKLHPDYIDGNLTESLQPLYNQGKNFVKETGLASSVGEFVGNALPAIVGGGVGIASGRGLASRFGTVGTIAGNAIPNAAMAALTAPEDKGTNAIIGGLLGASAPVLGASIRNVPNIASGTPVSALYKAGQQGEAGYKGLMRGSQTLDEAILSGADPIQAKAAQLAGNWLPDAKHGISGYFINQALGFGPIASLTQAAITSPRLMGEIAYVSGKLSGMSSRILDKSLIIMPNINPYSKVGVRQVDATLNK